MDFEIVCLTSENIKFWLSQPGDFEISTRNHIMDGPPCMNVFLNPECISFVFGRIEATIICFRKYLLKISNSGLASLLKSAPETTSSTVLPVCMFFRVGGLDLPSRHCD